MSDSSLNFHLDKINLIPDSIQKAKALGIILKNQGKISSASVLSLTTSRIALANEKDQVVIWKDAIGVLEKKSPRDTASLAFATNSLGEYLVQINRSEEAIKQFIHTISLYPENSRELELGYSYNNLGVLMGRKGDEGTALPYKIRALEIFLQHFGEDHPYMGTLYNNVGMSYQKLGNSKDELPFLLKALKSNKKHHAPCSHEMYTINNNLGLAYRNIKEFQKAEEYIKTALDCIGEENIKTDTRYVKLLTVLASIKYSNINKYSLDERESFYLEYIDLAEKHLGQYHPATKDLYNNFGVFLYSLDSAEASIQYFESYIYADFPTLKDGRYIQALTSDSITNKIPYLTILSNLGSAYYILFQQSKDIKDLEKSSVLFTLFDELADALRPEIINASSRLELKRGSNLGYVMHNRTLETYEKIKPSNEILKKIYNNIEKIKNWELLEKYAFTKRSSEIASSELVLQIDSLKNQQGIATITRSNKKNNVEQNYLLDKLKVEHPEFYQRLYGSDVHSLKDLQAYCRRNDQDWIIYFHKSDGEFNGMLVNADTVMLAPEAFSNDSLEVYKQTIFHSLKNKDWNFVDASKRLHEMILGPYLPYIKSKHLTFQPHSSLFSMPLSLLINEEEQNNAQQFDFAYIVKKYVVSYAYSGSLAIETEMNNHVIKRPFFIAPEYEEDRLHFNVSEINKGLDAVGGFALTRSEATKMRFLQEYQKHDHTHFAGHISSQDNIDSSYLLLSGERDTLFLSEIINLRSTANLVVLSGCESGLGESSPEALISPAYGFTFAGSPNVIASMWQNNDESSSLIFDAFYQNLRDGNGSAKSMQLAKLDYLNSVVKPEKHPTYWAPFVYYGNQVYWEKKSNWIQYGIGAMVLLLVFGLYYRSRKANSASS